MYIDRGGECGLRCIVCLILAIRRIRFPTAMVSRGDQSGSGKNLKFIKLIIVAPCLK